MLSDTPKAALFTLLFLAAVARADDRSDIIDLATEATIYPVKATGSMLPTLDENWLLLVVRRRWAHVQVGDIVVFRRPGTDFLIVHRVWNRSSGGTLIMTRGDRNDRPDPFYVSEAEYVGTVVGLVRRDVIKEP